MIWGLGLGLEGQGDLVSKLNTWIIRVGIWLMGIIGLHLLSSPEPPSRVRGRFRVEGDEKTEMEKQTEKRNPKP